MANAIFSALKSIGKSIASSGEEAGEAAFRSARAVDASPMSRPSIAARKSAVEASRQNRPRPLAALAGSERSVKASMANSPLPARKKPVQAAHPWAKHKGSARPSTPVGGKPGRAPDVAPVTPPRATAGSDSSVPREHKVERETRKAKERMNSIRSKKFPEQGASADASQGQPAKSSFMSSLMSGAGNAMRSFGNGMRSAGGAVAGGIGAVAGGIGAVAGGVAAVGFGVAGAAIGGVAAVGGVVGRGMYRAGSAAGSAIGSSMSSAGRGISSVASDVGSGMSAVGSAMPTMAKHGLDTLGVSAISGAVGGVHGGMTYDPNQERDPLLAQTPVIGRFKAAAKGALTGAAYGAAGAAGVKALQFGAGAAIRNTEAGQFANTDTILGSFARGFKGMDAPGDMPIGEAVGRGKRTAGGSGYYSFSKVHGKALDDAEKAIATHADEASARRMPVAQEFAPWLDNFKAPAQAPKTGPQQRIDAMFGGAPSARGASAEEISDLNLQKQLYATSDETGLNLNTPQGMAQYEKTQKFRKLNEQQQGMVGATELPGIIASTIGGAMGTISHAAKAATHAYKTHVLEPARNPATKATSSSLGRIHNPNYEGPQSGVAGIKETLSRDTTSQFVGGAGLIGGASLGIVGAMSATSYGAPAGHPMNAMFRAGDSAITAKAQMEADAAQKIKMQRPTMLGLNDSDEAYYTNPALKPRSGARHTPGKYNDDGSLVFALSNLRRA